VILKPDSREDLSALLASNFASGGKVEKIDFSAVASLVEHQPEDMTASVEAGMTLRAFQERLRASGQWLPIDPPDESITIGDLLAFDVSGSRRLGYGTIRDYLIGIRVAMADGTLIKPGGKVVKNVAGYDLCKLFIGARHSIGIIVEGTFKLRPLPEKEKVVGISVASMEELESTRAKLWSSRVEPVMMDGYSAGGTIRVQAAFAGNREDVDAQMEIARGLGFVEQEENRYAAEFWSGIAPKKVSVLPSRTAKTLAELGATQWLAHLGNGVIYYHGGKVRENKGVPAELKDLMKRVKNEFDPKRIFPNYNDDCAA
jgi:FAD/FMN-containing dehydrogenase